MIHKSICGYSVKYKKLGGGCMKKAKFLCKRCPYEFVIEIFEPGEKEEKRLRGVRPSCPKCHGPVERVK